MDAPHAGCARLWAPEEESGREEECKEDVLGEHQRREGEEPEREEWEEREEWGECGEERGE